MNRQVPLERVVRYTLVLLVVYLVNTANLPLEFRGSRIDLLGCVPAAVALMEGPYLGMAYGIAVGLCYDMAQTGAEGLYPIYFMLFGIAAGIFADHFLRRILPSMLLLTAASVLGLAAFRLMGFFLLDQPMNVVFYFQRICGEALLTTVLSPLVYWPIHHSYRRTYRRRR